MDHDLDHVAGMSTAMTTDLALVTVLVGAIVAIWHMLAPMVLP